jgi:hypothetical protein
MKPRFGIRKIDIITLISFTLVSGFFVVLLFFTDMYADDFYYGTFFKGSISSFFYMNGEHYLDFNGRVIVHLLVQVILICKPILFPLFVMVIVYMLFGLPARAYGGSTNAILQSIIIGELLILLIPITVLRESALWVSASMNYMYPALMTVVCLLTVLKIYESKASKFSHLWFFLAGATTEQCGTALLLLLALLWLHSTSKMNAAFRRKITIAFIFVLIGVATVFLSPGTITRVGRENSYGIENLLEKLNLTDILSRFCKLSVLATGKKGAGIIVTLFAALSGLYWRRKSVAFSYIYYVLSLLFIISAVKPFNEYFTALLFLFFTVFQLFAVIKLALKTREKLDIMAAMLSVVSFASLYAIIFTESLFPRVLLPFCLFSILTMTMYLNELLHDVRLSNLFMLLSVISIIAVRIPMLAGYINNSNLSHENSERINNSVSGEARFCLDYNDTYRHTMMFDDGYFYNQFRNYMGIDPSFKIYFYGKNCISLIYGGEEITAPVRVENGKTYAPIELIIYALGGDISFADGVTQITYNGKLYRYDSEAGKITYVANNKLLSFDTKNSVLPNMYLYFDTNIIEEIFGIEFIFQKTLAFYKKRFIIVVD